MKKKKRFWNITVKFLCLFLLIMIPATTFLAYECYEIACDNLNRKTEEYISDILYASSTNISSALSDLNNIVFSIKNDKTVQENLKNIVKLKVPPTSLTEYYTEQIINRALYTYVLYDDRIRQVYAIDNKNFYAYGLSKNKDKASFENATLPLDILDGAKGATVWLNPDTEGKELVMGSQINHLLSQETIGYILTYVNEKDIRSIYSDISIANEGEIALIRKDGVILSHEDPEMLSKIWGEEDNLLPLVSGKSFFSIENVSGAPHYVAGYQVLNKEMYLVVKIPVDINREEINAIAHSIVLIGVLLIAAAVLIYFFAAKKLFKPARDLSEAIRLFGEGELDTHFEVKSRDEIGIIAENFNQMAVNINELIDQVYQEQIYKQQAELRSLQMQINPHFLYNVLETINWMSRIKGIPEIGTVSKALGDLMRATIDGADHIPVSEELQNIRNYLYIQSFRFGDRLNVWFDIEEEILPYSVPKLFLQPLIENSIVHGFEEKVGTGNIMIKGYREKNSILFEIVDDGSGMTEEQRLALFNPIEYPVQKKKSSIGVRNVIARLKLYYGTKCSFHIESTLGEGTTIRIRIPLELSDNEKKEDEYETV